MHRTMLGFLLLIVTPSFSASALSAESGAARLLMGTYVSGAGGFQGEWSLELDLHRDGRAIYSVLTRNADESPSMAKRETFRGRWSADGGTLTVKFSDEASTRSMAYKITGCLDYVSNTSVNCAPGLEPTSDTGPDSFSMPLWLEIRPGDHQQK